MNGDRPAPLRKIQRNDAADAFCGAGDEGGSKACSRHVGTMAKRRAQIKASALEGASGGDPHGADIVYVTPT